MILLGNGKSSWYQWDINQRIIITDIEIDQIEGQEIHFSSDVDTDTTAQVTIPYVENGIVYAPVPNILLTISGTIHIYLYVSNGTEAHTEVHKAVKVVAREKPSDYVYTETEVKTWEELNERLKNAVYYTPEERTEEEKAQARENIGVPQSDYTQNDSTKPDYIKNRPGGYYEEQNNYKLDISAEKQDGIAELILVSILTDLFVHRSSIDVEIVYESSVIKRTLTQRYISEYVINQYGAQIYGNAHLIDASQPDTGEDVALYKEMDSQSNYSIGWHVWATSVPSGNVEVCVFEKTMNAVHFDPEFIPWYASPTKDAVLYTAQSLTDAQKAQARANIGAGTPYTLPEASPDALGGVKADSAEATDTQPVRIGEDGKLYTAAGGTDISLGLTSAAVGQIIKVKAIDESGKPTEWEAVDMPSGGGGDIPEALPNPYALTFTGAVTGSYDGSEAVSVEIPGDGYIKPDSGIPKSDLSNEVQTSLSKADTALQEHQDISGKVDKVEGKGLSTEDYTTEEKSKLNGINIDEIKNDITDLQTALIGVSDLIGGDA